VHFTAWTHDQVTTQEEPLTAPASAATVPQTPVTTATSANDAAPRRSAPWMMARCNRGASTAATIASGAHLDTVVHIDPT
jgi:hypothetical protein